MKQNWIVRMKCEVIKEIVTELCTEEEAREMPWAHCDSEIETEQVDWEVISVKPNS